MTSPYVTTSKVPRPPPPAPPLYLGVSETDVGGGERPASRGLVQNYLIASLIPRLEPELGMHLKVSQTGTRIGNVPEGKTMDLLLCVVKADVCLSIEALEMFAMDTPTQKD